MTRNAWRAGLESVAGLDLALWQYSGDSWLSALYHYFRMTSITISAVYSAENHSADSK